MASIATLCALTMTMAASVVPPPATASAAPVGPSRPPATARVSGPVTVRLAMPRDVSNQIGSRAVVVVRTSKGTLPAGRVVVRGSHHVLGRATTSAGHKRVKVRLELRRMGAGVHRMIAVFRAPGRRGRSQPIVVTSHRGCAFDPHVCGFASAATTGVPRGVRLRPTGSVTITRPGTVVRRLDIAGTLTIRASNVTVRNTRVRGSGFWMISIDGDATGVVIQNVDVDGLGRNGTEGSSGIVGGSATIVRTRITGVENGIVPGSGSRVEDSYVHGLAAPGSPHFDGIQIDGNVRDVSMTGSTIDISDHTQTSAVMIDNGFGPVSRISVTHNLLMGGGYTVYADGSFSSSRSISGVTYARNRMVRGYYGYGLIRNAAVTWSGNVVDSTGSQVRR